MGIVIECSDFTVSETSAALVLNKVFSPSLGSAAATALALATFGVAFFVRPLGAVLLGDFDDRLRCKDTLVRWSLWACRLWLSAFLRQQIPSAREWSMCDVRTEFITAS
jgi:hypothetical protein